MNIETGVRRDRPGAVGRVCYPPGGTEGSGDGQGKEMAR
jgi:hypothetical protein